MRKICLFVVFLAVCGLLCLPVKTSVGDVTPVSSLIKGEMITQINKLVTAFNGIVDSNDKVTATGIGTIAIYDSDNNTSATGYTPNYIGQALIGKAGAGTNAIWISKGTTSNDWVSVALN